MAHVKFFASFRERLDCSEVSIEEPYENVSQIVDWLLENQPGFSKIANEKICFAVDHNIANIHSKVRTNSEIALFPPVTGG